MTWTNRFVVGVVGLGLLAISVVNAVVIGQQQRALETLVAAAAEDVELDSLTQSRVWDLHRRVQALEDEDTRIMAHVRWFVMRRSGTDELRKMEAAVAKLEVERAGD